MTGAPETDSEPEEQPAHRELRDRLTAAGRLIPTGADGIYGRDAVFESVIAGIDNLVGRVGAADRPTRVTFPPLIPRVDFDRLGYLRNFPQLVGLVFSFEGDAAEHRTVLERLDDDEPYSDLLTQSELALTPARCYPVYPMLRGVLGDEGRVFETTGYCFRHEPSLDPMRLQAFRQHEQIRVATPDLVLDWRTAWLERAPQLLADLGLDVVSDVANDPFFGRAGRLLSKSQREQGLKIEFLVDVYGADRRTACASINDHQDHFGEAFEITDHNGCTAHSSCIGFGLERIAVALFARFGMEVDRWPTEVRDRIAFA